MLIDVHKMHNYEHSMGNPEQKKVIYLRHNRFWTKNRTPGSDEDEAFGITHRF